jgi:hypothetical protein
MAAIYRIPQHLRREMMYQEGQMWRLYRMLVGIIPCHLITKVGGYMVAFRTVTAISYTRLTLLHQVESTYTGILFLMLVPSGLFRRTDTPIMQIMEQSI